MYCKKCGKSISDDSKFCPECGTRCDADIKENDGAKIVQLKCKQCGATMDVSKGTSEIYCKYCGNKILIIDSDAVAVEKIKSNAKKDMLHATLAHEEKKLDKLDKIEALEKYKKSKLKLFSIIVGIICVISCITAFSSRHYLASLIALLQTLLLGISWSMGMQVIPEKKKNLHVALAALAFILIIPFIKTNSIKVYDRLNWPEDGLATILPKPKGKYGEITTNSDSSLYIRIGKSSQDDFNKYVDSCKGMGFVIESEQSISSYNAYNADGYDLCLSFYDDYYVIDLDAPMKPEIFTWPSSDLVKLLPVPRSNIGKINYEHADSFSVDIANTTREEYANYVDQVLATGFDINYSRSDDNFWADDINGNHAGVNYVGFNTMRVYIDAPDEPQEINTPEPTIDSSVASKETVDEDNIDPTATTDTEMSADGVSSDLKEALDEYESFMDEYIAFMEKYNESNDSLEMIADYSKMLAKLESIQNKIDAIDEDSLSDTDYLYYSKVMLRCSQKIANANID